MQHIGNISEPFRDYFHWLKLLSVIRYQIFDYSGKFRCIPVFYKPADFIMLQLLRANRRREGQPRVWNGVIASIIVIGSPS